MNLTEQLASLIRKKAFVWISTSNRHDLKGQIVSMSSDKDLIHVKDDQGASDWIVIRHIVMIRETEEMGEY